MTFSREISEIDEFARVEVKGVAGDLPIVLLTKHEIDVAKADVTWRLAVVTNALSSSARVIEFTREQAVNAAQPYLYKANLTTCN